MMPDDDYVASWSRRVIESAPDGETPDDVLALVRREPFLNRGRWAAYMVRLGEANRRRGRRARVDGDGGARA